MHFIAQRPSPPLDLFVELLWWKRREAPWLDCEHMLPTGTAQLIITLHDRPITWQAPGSSAWNTWRGGIVHGPQSSYYIAGPKPTGELMGVAFRPAAAPVLGVPLSELADRHITLDALWGARGRELRQRLMEAADASSAISPISSASFASSPASRQRNTVRARSPARTITCGQTRRRPACKGPGKKYPRSGPTPRLRFLHPTRVPARSDMARLARRGDAPRRDRGSHE